MFSRFSQASPKTYHKYGGSGLGLFISQKLVELQGGGIGFTSEAGCGSTFAFFVKAHQTRAPETFNFLTPSCSPDGSVGPQHQAQVNLLLVEDNLVNQKVLRKQLERQGYKVHTADNGQEAFDFIKSSQHWMSLGEIEAARPLIDVM